MGGQDKGLVNHQGRPLAAWVLSSLARQTEALCVSANRNLQAYQAMLAAQHAADTASVWPDDPDLPPHSGPLAGIVTLLRHAPGHRLMIVPCDMPQLPHDLVARLLAQAVQDDADVVIPQTHAPGEPPRYHWVCALVHKRVSPQTLEAFVKGERKAGNWVRSLRWSSVCFADTDAFANMNTLETLHGRD